MCWLTQHRGTVSCLCFHREWCRASLIGDSSKGGMVGHQHLRHFRADTPFRRVKHFGLRVPKAKEGLDKDGGQSVYGCSILSFPAQKAEFRYAPPQPVALSGTSAFAEVRMDYSKRRLGLHHDRPLSRRDVYRRDQRHRRANTGASRRLENSCEELMAQAPGPFRTSADDRGSNRPREADEEMEASMENRPDRTRQSRLARPVGDDQPVVGLPACAGAHGLTYAPSRRLMPCSAQALSAASICDQPIYEIAGRAAVWSAVFRNLDLGVIRDDALFTPSATSADQGRGRGKRLARTAAAPRPATAIAWAGPDAAPRSRLGAEHGSTCAKVRIGRPAALCAGGSPATALMSPTNRPNRDWRVRSVRFSMRASILHRLLASDCFLDRRRCSAWTALEP